MLLISFISLPISTRLGILEKKKDFQKRAKHLHKKKELIDNLKEKAFLRNPEEFAYGMIHAKTNLAGQIDKGQFKAENPHAVTKREYKETRHCVREPRSDKKGSVHKFAFVRKR
jgi:hypothetical protein